METSAAQRRKVRFELVAYLVKVPFVCYPAGQLRSGTLLIFFHFKNKFKKSCLCLNTVMQLRDSQGQQEPAEEEEKEEEEQVGVVSAVGLPLPDEILAHVLDFAILSFQDLPPSRLSKEEQNALDAMLDAMSDEEYEEYFDRTNRRTALQVCKKWYDVFWNNQTNVIVYASTMSVHASLARATSVILVPNSDSVQEPLTGLQWPNVTKIYIRYQKIIQYNAYRYKEDNIKALATFFDRIAEFVRVKDLTAPYYFMQLITHPLPYLVSLQLAEGIYPSAEPLDWLYRLGSTLTSLTFVETDVYNTTVHIDLKQFPRLQQFDMRSVEFTTAQEHRLRVLALVEASPQLTKIIVRRRCCEWDEEDEGDEEDEEKLGDESIAFGRALFEVSNRTRCAFLSATFSTDNITPRGINSVSTSIPKSLLLWILDQPQPLKEFLLPRVPMACLSPFVRALWGAREEIVSAMISHAVKHGFIDELIAWVPVGVSRRSMLAYATDHNIVNYDLGLINRIEDICLLLIHHGSSLNDLDDFGYAPVHAAVARRQLDMVQLLVRYGADISQPPAPQHGTILHIASKYNAMAMQLNRGYFDWTRSFSVEMLSADGPCISFLTSLKPYMFFGNFPETFHLDPNARDSWGRTPLHYAAWAWETRHWIFHWDTEWDLPVKELVKAGADIHARDVFGCTPIHYATNVASVLKCLSELGGDVFA
jgi:hypothetical protein